MYTPKPIEFVSEGGLELSVNGYHVRLTDKKGTVIWSRTGADNNWYDERHQRIIKLLDGLEMEMLELAREEAKG